jgi:hypothetical protein
LDELSLLGPGDRIEARQVYRGAPAVCVGRCPAPSLATLQARTPSLLRSFLMGSLQIVGSFLPVLAAAFASSPASVLLFRYPKSVTHATTTLISQDTIQIVSEGAAAIPTNTAQLHWIFGAAQEMGVWRFILLPVRFLFLFSINLFDRMKQIYDFFSFIISFQIPLAFCFLVLLVLASVVLKHLLIGRFAVPNAKHANGKQTNDDESELHLQRGQMWAHSGNQFHTFYFVYFSFYFLLFVS